MKVGRSCMGGGYIIASIYMYSYDLMRQPAYIMALYIQKYGGNSDLRTK